MHGKQVFKALLLGSAVLAAGCSDNARQGYYDAKDDYSVFRAKWSPVYVPSRSSRAKDGGIEWTQLTYVAAFHPGTARLTSSARAGLANLGGRHGNRGNRVTVLLDYPADAKARRLVEQRRRVISTALAQNGLSARNIRAVPGAKHRNAAVILLGVRRAVVASCPEWRATITGKIPLVEQWRYGCATRSALRAHVDNPSDLVRGRPLDGMDGVAADKSIKDYRDGKLDKLPDSDGTSGGTTQ